MGFFREMGGIFPLRIEQVSTTTRVTRLPRADSQSEKLRSQALAPNHSSRDKGPQLQVGTSGTRRGNGRVLHGKR